MPLFNNIVIKLESGLSTIGNLLIIAEGKETLIPDFTELEVSKRFKLTLIQSVGNIIAQMEIVRVISKNGKSLIIERAVEPCPLNGNAKVMSQIAYEFKAGDIAKMTMTAGEYEIIKSEINTKLSLSGGKMTGALYQNKGLNIASDTITDLSKSKGNLVYVTGNKNIENFGEVPAGAIFVLFFETSLTLVHNGGLFLPTGSNIVTQNNDFMTLISNGLGEWRVVSYTRFNGQALDNSVNINGLEENLSPLNNFFGVFWNGIKNVKTSLYNITNGLRTSSYWESGVIRIARNEEVIDGIAEGIAVAPSELKRHYKVITHGTQTNINVSISSGGPQDIYSTVLTSNGISIANLSLIGSPSGSSTANLQYREDSISSWNTIYSNGTTAPLNLSFFIKKGEYRIYLDQNYVSGSTISGSLTTMI